MDKVAQTVKTVTAKVADAACEASFNLGMADALAITGLALLGISAWVRSRIKEDAWGTK